MKTAASSSHLNSLISGQNPGLQNVRLIKAGQAEKFLHPRGGSHGATNKSAPGNPVIRLVGTGTDYCDLEVTCGCGETVQVRCWNAPVAESQIPGGKE